MTIWGVPDTIREIAPGIDEVSTSSHGGFILSPERLAQMPENLRSCSFTKDNHFEQDCSWCAVIIAWPEFFSVDDYNKASAMYDNWYAKKNKVSKAGAVALILMLLSPCAQADDRFLSPNEYERMTRETPILMDCTYDKEHGWYDCPALEYKQPSYAPPSRRNEEDYLPPVVPEQSSDMPPLLPTLVGAVNEVCRKVGKNTEYCGGGGHYGANDILREME